MYISKKVLLFAKIIYIMQVKESLIYLQIIYLLKYEIILSIITSMIKKLSAKLS